MAAYWISRCHVTNQEDYSKYAELAGPVIESFGGRFLARGGEQVDSPEYREAFKHQEHAAERHVVIVEGV